MGFNKGDTIHLIDDYEEPELPNIYAALIIDYGYKNQIVKHSLLDIQKNKVYKLEYPIDYDGQSTEGILKSIEVWDARAQKNDNDIPIGNNQYISWIDVDWVKEPVFRIEKMFNSVQDLFDGLELGCVRACCGKDAFYFDPESIQNAQGNVDGNVKVEVKSLINEVKQVKEEVVSLSHLNQLFEKTVLVNLLEHIYNNLK